MKMWKLAGCPIPLWPLMLGGERRLVGFESMNAVVNFYKRIRGIQWRNPPSPGVVRTPPARDESPSAEDLTVFVTTVGDQPNFSDCMAHLQAQTVRVPIDIIDHVAPMSEAFQEMHRRCRTDYYLQVDEDMILFPEAIETMRGWMRSAAWNVAMICSPLWDCDAERAIYGLKIYRSSIVKNFPYENTLSCEINQRARLERAGYHVVLHPLGERSSCLGEHGKHYTPESIFKRWQRCFRKHRRFCHMDWIEPYAQRLLERYVATGQTLHLYAFLGAVAGIVGAPAVDAELDWRDPNSAFEDLRHYFPPDC